MAAISDRAGSFPKLRLQWLHKEVTGSPTPRFPKPILLSPLDPLFPGQGREALVVSRGKRAARTENIHEWRRENIGGR